MSPTIDEVQIVQEKEEKEEKRRKEAVFAPEKRSRGGMRTNRDEAGEEGVSKNNCPVMRVR